MATPEGWTSCSIADLTTLRRGFTWKKHQQHSEPAPGRIPVLRIPNVQARLELEDLLYLDGVSTQDRERFRVTEGYTLLVGSNGNAARVGNCAFVDRSMHFVFASFLIAAVPSGDRVVAEYLYRLLDSAPVQAAITESVQGSTGLKNISLGMLRTVQVRLPPLPAQRKIAAMLSSVDETIEKTEAVIAQLQVVKTAMMQELLTRGMPGRHTRFKRTDPGEWRLGRLASGIVDVPEVWSLVRIDEVARLESGHTPSRKRPEYWAGDIPWVSLHDSKGLDGPNIFETSQTIGALGLANSSARLLPRDTVVFSRTATVGKCTVLGREMATSQDFANYVCGSRLDHRYLMHLFRHMQAEWKRLMAGSTHQTIYMPVFRDLQILLPPLEEQREIATVADQLDARMAQEVGTVAALRATKGALSAALLSGDLRVTPDEVPQ
jgi:type I restriction enzyme S subunit